MVNAQPVSGVKYRKSQRSQAASEEVAKEGPTSTSTDATPRRAENAKAPEHADQPAAKRTRTTTDAHHAINEEPSALGSTAGPGSHNATTGTTADVGETSDSVNVTLMSSSEIRAPAGNNIALDAESQIAANRAMVLRMKEEALARSRAGESAEDLGLVEESSPSKVRGIKRTAQVSSEQEAVEISGGVAHVSPSTGAGAAVNALKPNKEQREIRANKRIVKPEEATRKQAIWGGILLGAGAGLAYLASNFL